ncbi:hypothetical protein E4T56_gene15353 [Termitomyces sp. T112]|nr:hypothetical protein E4T56_gene15353 [Termitomyces sp. T112]KAH0585619.1 hypothetical protein H2248_008845 [Termitomyces sp. 'cryptogamus']KNZ80187.1 Fruiting body protein SC1 [Termitomyces sp. J132]
MFARLSAAIVLALPLLAAATCSSGQPQCCNSLLDATTDGVAQFLENLLGVDVQSITGLVGLTCGPLSAGCTQQNVCCSNNNFNGLVALGCTPINVGL